MDTAPLIEFLLARIDDDERWLTTLQRVAQKASAGITDANMDSLTASVGPLMFAMLTDRDAIIEMGRRNESGVRAPSDAPQLLADIATKRHIVALCIANKDAGGGYDPEAEMAVQILRLLVTLYADHPDYQEKWQLP